MSRGANCALLLRLLRAGRPGLISVERDHLDQLPVQALQ